MSPPSHVALARRHEHGARAEEQQTFEQRVIEHMQHGCRERERGGELHALRLKGERQAEADENDADILDRVVG